MLDNEKRRPAGNGAASTSTPDTHHYTAGLRRRRATTCRLPVLDCGHVDPWTCRHDADDITDQYIDGYRDAAQHLLANGLTPAPNLAAMRAMWRRGGAERDLVRVIAERWQVSA